MTLEEHKLIVAMFAKQYQQIKVLIEILKSRGLLEGDDPIAFATAVHSDAESNSLLFRQAREHYVQVAKYVGVQTGLENP